jgi:hypothetical protein
MEPNETSKPILYDIAARANHAGHVLLEGAEIAFACSPEGKCWLERVDVEKRLYKLTPAARQQIAL